MKSRCLLVAAFVCAVLSVGSAAPLSQLLASSAVEKDQSPSGKSALHTDTVEVAASNEDEVKVAAPAQDQTPDGLTPVVIPEHVHMVDKRSPHKKYGGGGYGGGGYGGGGYPGGGGGCNVCGGGGGGYPGGGHGGYGGGGRGGHGGYGGGGGGAYSQSSSSSQSSSGSWGKK